MDIDKATNTVDKADGFFTRLNAFIKKHPIWFILILVIAFFWWVSTLPDEEVEKATPTEYIENPIIIDTYEEYNVELQKTETIDVWSDGIETVAE